MAAGFGQGISTTPVQQLQALTIVANDGVMVKPHIIDRVVNTSSGEETKTEIVKSEKIVSSKTINKIKDLMENVISENSPTGKSYYMEGYDLIGKTGTAQIFENGAYLTGVNDYIISIGLMYPKNNPEIIIYAAIKKPSYSANVSLINPVKELVKNISKYKGMFSDDKINNIELYKLNTYISKNTNIVKEELENNNLDVIVIGNGNKIIKQFPNKNTEVLKGDKIFLLTNGTEYKMHNVE
jgi:penicillin-binding protein 2B